MGRTLKYTNRYCSFINYCENNNYTCCYFCKKSKCKNRCKDYDNKCKYLTDYNKANKESLNAFINSKTKELKN